MKFFLKLNVVSAIMAFMLFVSIELQLNFYRIWRITGWEVDTVNIVSAVIHIVGFILSTILFGFLMTKWLKGKKGSFWSVILWFPYLLLFIRLFVLLFPMTNRGDMPAPVSGLIIIALVFMYPIYLLIVAAICTTNVFAVEGKSEEKEITKGD